jgi:hypothetical protein
MTGTAIALDDIAPGRIFERDTTSCGLRPPLLPRTVVRKISGLVRRRLALSLRFRCFNPPPEIVGKARERALERFAATA